MEGLQNNGVCAVNRMLIYRMMCEQSMGKDATRSEELALTSDPVTDPGPEHSPATAIHPASAASIQGLHLVLRFHLDLDPDVHRHLRHVSTLRSSRGLLCSLLPVLSASALACW